MSRLFSLMLAVLLMAGCGGGNMGTLRGKVVVNGEPFSIPQGEQASLVLFLLDENGKPQNLKSYPTMLAADGTFELAASGGQAPVGKYMVTLDIAPMLPSRTHPKSSTGMQGKFVFPNSPLRAEIVGGANNLVVDLAKVSP